MGYTNSPLVAHTHLSPNNSGQRTHAIDTITIHCVVGQCTAEGLGDWFGKTSTQASSNYGVDKNGRVGLYCEEKNRSWCTSSRDNDQRAITIEVASDTSHPYAVRDVAYNATIELVADICKRNGKNKIIWFGDKEKTLAYNPAPNEMIMTVHRWFANKSCPGQYLYDRHPDIAAKVNALIGGEDITPEAKPDTEAPEAPQTAFKIGDIVNFTGDTHYTNANASTGPKCKPGKAKITAMATGKHPIHLVREPDGGSSVWGWVDAEYVKAINTAQEAPKYDLSDGAMTDEEIFNRLKKDGLTDAGAAGLMGNLMAESAMRSINLQNTYEKKFNMTDEQYTIAVDNGTYTDFVRDSAGYGLAQWTYWSRKEALLKYMNEQHVSIGNKMHQIEFLLREIKGYKNTYQVLTTTTSVKDASYVVLTEFERPANQDESVQATRAKYSQTFYDKYATKEEAPVEPQKPAEQPKPVDPTPTPSQPKIKAGDLVRIKGSKWYGGTKTIPGWVKNQNWYVASANGDRVVINENEARTNSICSPININDIELVNGNESTTPEPMKVGDIVKIKKGCKVYGKDTQFQSWVYDSNLYIREIREKSVVVSTLKSGAITGVVATEDIIR